MSARRRPGLPAGWTIVRGPLEVGTADTSVPCSSCGRATRDAVLGDSFSVVSPNGGRRLAPPMPLCESCRRNVIYKRGTLPTWCAECQSWQPFGHDHDAFAASPVSGVAATATIPDGRAE